MSEQRKLIPDDVMVTAREAYLTFMDDDCYDDHIYGPLFFARILLAERESATKAENERCAVSIEEMGALRGEPKCCGYGIGSPPECCADPVLLISTSDAASVIRAALKPKETAA